MRKTKRYYTGPTKNSCKYLPSMKLHSACPYLMDSSGNVSQSKLTS